MRKKRKVAALQAANKKRKGQVAALQAANQYAKALHSAAQIPRPPPPTTSPRLLTKAQVLSLVPVTFPTLWNWMRADKFPRAKIIGTRSVWVEAEIYAWIAARPQRPLKELEQPPSESGGMK